MTVNPRKYAVGPLAKLETGSTDNQSGPKSLTFPHDLGEIAHTITFRAFKTTQLDRSSSPKKEVLTNISLPIPANLTTAYNLDYNIDVLGAVWQTIIDALGANPEEQYTRDARQLIGGIGASTIIAGIIGAGLGAKFSTGMDIGLLTSAITNKNGAAVSATIADLARSNDTSRAILGNYGIGINPHKVVLFESPQFKRHSFSYEFTPVSFAEAETLKEIIHYFKYHSAPGFASREIEPFKAAANIGLVPGFVKKPLTGVNNEIAKETNIDISTLKFDTNFNTSTGKHFFEYPEYFEIEFADDDKEHLFKIGNSFLESFSVDYHPSNTPSYSRDPNKPDKATPTQINLKMTFLETDIITKDKIVKDKR